MRPSATAILACLTFLLPATGANAEDKTSPASQSPKSSNAAAEKTADGNDIFGKSLEDLMDMKVETVSRVKEDLDGAPGAVYVITREMIKERGYSSLRDALQTVPGISIFHRDLDYVAAVRGLSANDNEKFTLLINGIEMKQMNEPDILNGPINLDNVERIEVIVGPSTIFRPADTLVATVNVITRQVDGVEAVVGGGNLLQYDTTLMGGKTWGERQSFNISGTLERRNGFDAWDTQKSVSPMTAFAGEDMTTKSTHPNHFIVATGQLEDWSMQLVSYQSRFVEMRLGGSTPASRNTDYRDTMYGGTVKNEHALTDDLSSIVMFSALEKESVRSTSTAPWQHLEQMVYTSEFGFKYTGFDKHLIQTGIQGDFEDNGDCFFDADGHTKQTFFDKNTWAVGLYLDDTYQLTDRWRLVGGIRADHNTLLGEDSDWYWGGRAAAIFKATDRWTTKWIYNKSVRMPSPLAALNEIWGKGVPGAPSWANGSPTAQNPEELLTIEWANIYYQDLKEFITWGAPHTNVGDYGGLGFELGVQHQATDTLSLWGNGSYIHSKFETYSSFDTVAQANDAHSSVDGDDRLIGAPSTTINVGADWSVLPKVVFTPAVRYFTDQPVEETYDAGTTTRFSHVTNMFYVDAGLLFKDVYRKGWDIQIAAKNILDNRRFVAGPWLIGEYRPAGATLELRAFLKF
jgi:outer membrane receptor for ferrienterochelin and colicin